MEPGNYDLDASGFDAAARSLRTEDVQALAALMPRVDRDLTDAERIDQIRALEELTCAAQAAQAELTADFDRSMRELAAGAGVPPERQGRGIAAQIAFARRESVHRTVETTTPTGHTYASVAPRLGRELQRSPAEAAVADLIWAA